MAATKTFTTLFQIGSKFSGKGFDQANRALSATQKHAAGISRGIGSAVGGFAKLTTAIGLAAVAYKVLREAQELWQEGWKASEDAVKVQEALGVAAQRNAKRYKMSGAAIEKSVSGVSAKVAAVGFDTEDATAGTTKLLESMSPKQIEGFAQSYADLTAKLKGATPGAEGFEEVSEQINSAILKGKAPWLSQIGATDAQLKAFKKLTPAARAAYLQQIIQNRLQGEAARVFETTSGKIAKAAKAREDVGQALTEASVAQQGKLAATYEQLYKELEPLAGEVGTKVAEAQQKFADWLITHKEDIIAIAKFATDWALWMWDKTLVSLDDTTRQLKEIWGLWVKSIEDTKAQFEAIVAWIDTYFIKPIYNLFSWLTEKVQAMWQLILPKLDALNLVNQQANKPVGTGGEAERRAIEGRTIQQKGKGYAPYTERGTKQIRASAGDVSAEQAQKATAVGTLKGERVRIAEELAQNPKLKQLLQASVKAEVGDQPAATQQAYMESIMNRAAAEKKTLESIITNPNYYPAATKNKLGRTFSPDEQARMEAMTNEVLAGSNVANFATGNESGTVTSGRKAGKWAPILSQPKGGYERFVGETWTRPWVERMQQAAAAEKTAAPQLKSEPTAMVPAGSRLKDMIKEMNLQQRTSGGTGGQNIAMNAPITVNGVAPGREALMAKKTALALRDPTAQLLTEIKRARTQEQRLGYV